MGNINVPSRTSADVGKMGEYQMHGLPLDFFKKICYNKKQSLDFIERKNFL
jgi:hypothetical protein